MPPKIDRWIQGYVSALSEEGYSFSKIIERCKTKDIKISKFGIHCIIKQNNNNTEKMKVDVGKPRKQRPRCVRNAANINKTKEMCNREDPPTQKHMANVIGTTPRTIRKIIYEDIKYKKSPKTSVHQLKPRHINERKTACRKLYENFLAGDRWKFVVTMDEAWVYLSDCNKKRAFFYHPRGNKPFTKWYREAKEKFSRGFMIVAGICNNGRLVLRKVDQKTKINSNIYQTLVLDPIFRQDIPSLYGNETDKVWFHCDKAPSHTSRSTAIFLSNLCDETKINVIPFKSIPVKSPDASPMDFCVFGLLKRALGKRRPSTVDGLWKICQEEWNNLDPIALQRGLLSWKLRCRAIAKSQGYPIEHLKNYRYGL